MKRVQLLADLDNGGGIIFKKCTVIETEDAAAAALIAAGKAADVPPGTPCRKDPTGYDSCMPPSPEKLAALRATERTAPPPEPEEIPLAPEPKTRRSNY